MARLVVKNKSISLLWELNSIFMLIVCNKILQIVFTVMQQKIKLETIQWKKPRKANFIKD